MSARRILWGVACAHFDSYFARVWQAGRLFDHVGERREAHHAVLADKNPLAVGVDAVTLRVEHVELAAGGGVAQIVDVRILDDVVMLVAAAERAEDDALAGQVEHALAPLGRFGGRVGLHRAGESSWLVPARRQAERKESRGRKIRAR